MQQPFDGVKILDFSRVLAGPYCTMLMADLGAEVIKIERPQTGDDTRLFGPYQNGESAYFSLLNRGKKSIELDLKNEEHIKWIKELVLEVDVVVENFRPGVMEKVGLGYKDLQAINPAIIYTSISGFGQYGPYTKRPAYDLVAQAMGGMTSITGYPDNPPTRTGNSLGDMSAALYAAFGTVTALYHREKTGVGQHVDIAMLDSIFSMLEMNVLRYTVDGIIPERIGSRHAISTPFDIYKTKDDYIVIAVANNPLFHKLCDAMGKAPLKEDSRFITDELRTENEKVLKEIMEEWLQRYSTAEAEDIIGKSGVPCSRINSIKDIVEDEHTAAREMIVDVNHPTAGVMKLVGNPVKLSKTPPKVGDTVPILGQHTEEILKKLLCKTLEGQ